MELNVSPATFLGEGGYEKKFSPTPEVPGVAESRSSEHQFPEL